MKKLLMIAGVVLAAKLAAQACDCVSPPVDKAFEKAAAVFAGTVQDVRDDRQSGVKIVTLTVKQAWKGLAADQKTVTVQTAQALTPAPPGLTVGLQENGSVVAAVHTSGKTMWQVKLPAAATAARVEGNQVIVEPSGLVLDLASGKAVQQPVAGLAPDQEVAVRTQATDWAQANGKTDWGAITRVVDHEDRWAVLFTKILAQGTKVESPAGVWIMKDTGNISELRGE
jgi:hypothetical protein